MRQSTARTFGIVLFAFAMPVLAGSLDSNGSEPTRDTPAAACRRPEPGSAVAQPRDLRSHDGVLQVDLAIYDQRQPDGSTRYCFMTRDGAQSPTLRLAPGDLLVVRFENHLVDFGTTVPRADGPLPFRICTARKAADACNGAMTAISSNLHFHGLSVPPVCHKDDVLKTSIQPGGAPFEYRFRIPVDAPPGLYWYHPHIHGYSKAQVLGGAYGALIIEGLERANPALAGLPERVLMIGDRDLMHPDAPPSKSEPIVGKSMIDRDGDAGNNGTGFGKPAKDLTINHVPVPYPDYPPASLRMKPGAREVWRVLNASAITYLNLAVLVRKLPQPLGIVAVDGVPVAFNGSPSAPIIPVKHVGIPPGGRVELVVDGPPAGVPALLVTRSIDTGPDGENDPNRAIAAITPAADAAGSLPHLPSNPKPLPPAAYPWVGDVAPIRVRKLYFSEKPLDPNDPNSPTKFFITVDGQTPKQFDMSSDVPDIVVKQGDVEDWIIENRSSELHDFHIHQLHFQLVDWSGLPVNEPFLRDSVNVPYFNGRMLQYPSVRLRMDFRDPNIVGTFVYHCHLLEHEDGGMMGRIRVEPAGTGAVHAMAPAVSTRGDAYDAR